MYWPQVSPTTGSASNPLSRDDYAAPCPHADRRTQRISATVLSVEADDLRAQDTVADSAGERLIADHLDALEAERVLQRALELEAEERDQTHVISTEQLERIAKEIGVDPVFVRQALGEVRLEPAERSRFVQWILPDDLIEAATIKGLTREEVDMAVTRWMTKHEGMIPSRILADGNEWAVDRRWRSRMLARSLSGGNRISRIASGDVTHRVHSISEREHMVALQSEGRLPLLFARLAIAAGLAVSSIVLLGAVVSNDVFAGLGVFALLFGLSTAVGVDVARRWARKIQGALRRSLVGFAGTAKPRRSTWYSRRRKKYS